MNPARSGEAPFHLYTMRQAIEEKFILDVLKNYIDLRGLFPHRAGDAG